jgi:hypothetical protein
MVDMPGRATAAASVRYAGQNTAGMNAPIPAAECLSSGVHAAWVRGFVRASVIEIPLGLVQRLGGTLAVVCNQTPVDE